MQLAATFATVELSDAVPNLRRTWPSEVTFGVLAIVVGVIGYSQYRVIPELWLALVVGVRWLVPRTRRRSFGFAALAVFIILRTSLPLDVSVLSRPGGPRVVPLVLGYPSPAAVAAERRGEIVLGGCVVSGFEPRRILVW